jgi:hypothetical protein
MSDRQARAHAVHHSAAGIVFGHPRTAGVAAAAAVVIAGQGAMPLQVVIVVGVALLVAAVAAGYAFGEFGLSPFETPAPNGVSELRRSIEVVEFESSSRSAIDTRLLREPRRTQAGGPLTLIHPLVLTAIRRHAVGWTNTQA